MNKTLPLSINDWNYKTKYVLVNFLNHNFTKALKVKKGTREYQKFSIDSRQNNGTMEMLELS